jgi:hypothetical protein
MNQPLSFYLLLVFNLFPIVGVAFFNWSPFEMFWLFWMETLIVAIFNTLRVLFSQELTALQAVNHPPLHINWWEGLRYLLGRIFIFLFYSIFIIVFIGFVSNLGEDRGHVLRTILMKNTLFNIALLLMLVSQGAILVKHFVQNGYYLISSVKDYPILFDSRQIFIHIAVIVGALGASFLFKEGKASGFASVWIISVFCVLKWFWESRSYANKPESVYPAYPVSRGL